MLITRRRLLRASLAAAASSAGVGLYTWQVEPHWLEVVRRPLAIRGLPTALHGRTLAQLSDIHVGPRVSDSYVAETFTRVAVLSPDIVVYTGDFTSYDTDVYVHASRVYRDAPTRPTGDVRHPWQPRLRTQLGSSRRCCSADDAARRDRHPHPSERGRRDRRSTSRWEQYHGWVLSGHTHGGQCKPPFLPPPLIPVQNRRYTAGEFDLTGDRKLYISRGVGHLLQVRLNVRPEVTLFELQPA
jgi:predicted MPP superfamily phosphohydrolase